MITGEFWDTWPPHFHPGPEENPDTGECLPTCLADSSTFSPAGKLTCESRPHCSLEDASLCDNPLETLDLKKPAQQPESTLCVDQEELDVPLPPLELLHPSQVLTTALADVRNARRLHRIENTPLNLLLSSDEIDDLKESFVKSTTGSFFLSKDGLACLLEKYQKKVSDAELTLLFDQFTTFRPQRPRRSVHAAEGVASSTTESRPATIHAPRGDKEPAPAQNKDAGISLDDDGQDNHQDVEDKGFPLENEGLDFTRFARLMVLVSQAERQQAEFDAATLPPPTSADHHATSQQN
ncbi:hypothetical protein BESB_082540 [Besnoitia besnoiti]|uniref:Uncharacterized protein n=1 Tax=Besnoitia besnoiti TaxID=94643 RepID=A0A2A9M514_BESBE|nr:hypothetical protein BESB_082540 [Besnoitia besnoiti]PFH33055.1 hypothetical protein BESB_082540 [Besnoitia besnoiti]